MKDGLKKNHSVEQSRIYNEMIELEKKTRIGDLRSRQNSADRNEDNKIDARFYKALKFTIHEPNFNLCFELFVHSIPPHFDY